MLAFRRSMPGKRQGHEGIQSNGKVIMSNAFNSQRYVSKDGVRPVSRSRFRRDKPHSHDPSTVIAAADEVRWQPDRFRWVFLSSWWVRIGQEMGPGCPIARAGKFLPRMSRARGQLLLAN